MDKLAILETYDNYVLAHIVKQRLEAEGILCMLKDEETVTMNWLLSNAIGGIKLLVHSNQLEEARTILNSIEWEANEDAEVPAFATSQEQDPALDPNNRICVHCGSKNTKKLDFQKRPAFLSILLLGFPLMFRSEKWHCFHCGKEF